MRLPLAVMATAAFFPTVLGGPIAYGLCQTAASFMGPINAGAGLMGKAHLIIIGCNILAVACYAAAGFTFGTVSAPAAPAAIIGCNSALGTCSATCAGVALLAPTP